MDAGRDLSGGTPPGRVDDPEVLRRLLDASPNLVLLVDDDGTVRWINAAVGRIGGYEVPEVIGTNLLDHVDPDWDPYAFDSIGAALAAEGLRLPMLFRMVCKDGSRKVCEAIANAQLHDPVLGGLAVYLRVWDERQLLDQALEALAGGRPTAETLELLLAVVACETLEGEGAIVRWAPDEGTVMAIDTPGLPGLLGRELDLGGTGPWAEAVATGQPVLVPVEDLDEAEQVAATARGLRYCWSWPILSGDDVARGCVVVWRRDGELEADHTRVLALDRIARLAGLAFDMERMVSSLRHAATHDPLTGLANRARFDEELVTGRTDRRAATVGLLAVDLDDFKPINDGWGHAAGDAVLGAVATRLRSNARAGDLAARLGGDEFAVVCHGIDTVAELEGLVARIHREVTRPVRLPDGTDVAVGATIGAVLAPADTAADALMRLADDQLYAAKRSGKGRCRVADHLGTEGAGPPLS